MSGYWIGPGLEERGLGKDFAWLNRFDDHFLSVWCGLGELNRALGQEEDGCKWFSFQKKVFAPFDSFLQTQLSQGLSMFGRQTLEILALCDELQGVHIVSVGYILQERTGAGKIVDVA